MGVGSRESPSRGRATATSCYAASVNPTRCEVTASELDEAGCGVGTSDGRTCHVTNLLPGERAEVAIDHTSPHRPEAWGRIVRYGAQLSRWS